MLLFRGEEGPRGDNFGETGSSRAGVSGWGYLLGKSNVQICWENLAGLLTCLRCEDVVWRRWFRLPKELVVRALFNI